jgi:hypothetical protein
VAGERETVLCESCERFKWRREDGQPRKHDACWRLLPGPEGSGAKFSEDGNRRFVLWRRWGEPEYALWVLLNPSDADEHVDDPTIDKLMMLTKDLGLESLFVVNLDPQIQSDSSAVKPFTGRMPENEANIKSLAKDADRVILAWGGVDRSDRRNRMVQVLTCLRTAGWGFPGDGKRKVLECVTVNRTSKFPGHPQRRSLESMKAQDWHPPTWLLSRLGRNRDGSVRTSAP